MKLVKKFGSHSDSHPHVNNLSYEKNIEEIEKSNDKIEKVIFYKIFLYICLSSISFAIFKSLYA